MPNEVFLYNTLSRQKDAFKPLIPGKVSANTCGPTVYHFAHIGNLRTYVFEDLLMRVLRRAGYQVNHVMNITDVGHLVNDGDDGEDKLEVGSRREGKTAWEVAEFYSQAFFSDFDKLGCQRPNVICKATDHIKEMIELVQRLEKNGLVYKTSDGLYFDTVRFPTYGNFAKLDVENLEAGKRVAMGEKHRPTDFALWKFSPATETRQMEWASPWGKGFPGWHIECSAMAMKYLGETFDIHCGGKDHVPVHHTNEIAQSEGATGKRFANYWLHGAFLTVDEGRMGKSQGNFLTVSVLEENGFAPADYRFLLLQAHYRSELDFHFEALRSAQSGLKGLVERLTVLGLDKMDGSLAQAAVSTRMQELLAKFDRALNDDLNSAEAISVLFAVLKDNELSAEQKKALIYNFDETLGLGLAALVQKTATQTIPDSVLALARARDQARKDKNWAESDRLRAEIAALGFKAEDSPQGTKVSRT
jgi:cysteinyl-tRNA synthetase